MANDQDLIALALIKQGKERYMPIGGKSIKESIDVNKGPAELGEKLAKEILLRVFQKSETEPIKRAAGEKSLLVIQMQLENMQDKLPPLKANWIESGNNNNFISDLKEVSFAVWSLNYTRNDGMQFSKI